MIFLSRSSRQLSNLGRAWHDVHDVPQARGLSSLTALRA
jgi:hypothetical protein